MNAIDSRRSEHDARDTNEGICTVQHHARADAAMNTGVIDFLPAANRCRSESPWRCRM
jgi:hypothetical protein